MTGQLRTSLHEHADALHALDLDLDTIVRDGDRRLRRRRLAVVGGVAVALVAAAGITALAWDRPSSTVAPADDGTTRPLSYAVGSVIHSGTDTIDVGVRVDSFVPTADGFVISDPQGQVYAERDGELQKIGQLASRRTRLVADDSGDHVAWWDGAHFQLWSASRPAGATVTDSIDAMTGAGATPSVRAVTGNAIWLGDARGTVVGKMGPGGTALTPVGSLPDPESVQDAAAGRLLVRVDEPGGTSGMAVRDLTEMGSLDHGPVVTDVYSGDLAPDGRHWLTDSGDVARVYDSVTGAGSDLPHPGFQFAAPYTWLDDDTLAMLALSKATNDPAQPISLLTCHVSTDQCTVAARDIGTAGQIALPVGLSLAAQ